MGTLRVPGRAHLHTQAFGEHQHRAAMSQDGWSFLVSCFLPAAALFETWGKGAQRCWRFGGCSSQSQARRGLAPFHSEPVSLGQGISSLE